MESNACNATFVKEHNQTPLSNISEYVANEPNTSESEFLNIFFVNLNMNNSNISILAEINATSVPCLEHAPTLNHSTLIRVGILATMAILGIVGNGATLISLRKGKKKRSRARPSYTAIYSLIFQLSIADLLVSVFCMAGEAAWSLAVQWYAGNVACKLFKFLQMFALYLSTFVLALIGVDWWLAVRYPLKTLATATRNRKLVIIAWTLSFVLSIPQLIVFRVTRAPFVEEFYQCVTHGFYTARWQEQTYLIISLAFMFILPLIILIATNVSTVHTLSQSKNNFKQEVSQQEERLTLDKNRTRILNRAKMKSLRMSVVIVTAFVIWWTPYHIMMIIFTFLNPDKKQSEGLLSGIFFFGMSNSLVNPIIYGAFHLWPKRKSSTDSERENRRQRQMQKCHKSTLRVTTIITVSYTSQHSTDHNVSLLKQTSKTSKFSFEKDKLC